MKRIYLSNDNISSAEKDIIKSIFHESILINIRTYDSHSLVLYANDQFNNFIHLYITNSNEVVYLYNHGDEIVNLTIVHSELNSGRSIQIAVIRTEDSSTMFVNDKNVTVTKGYKLLDVYTNKPWQNPEKGERRKAELLLMSVISPTAYAVLAAERLPLQLFRYAWNVCVCVGNNFLSEAPFISCSLAVNLQFLSNAFCHHEPLAHN